MRPPRHPRPPPSSSPSSPRSSRSSKAKSSPPMSPLAPPPMTNPDPDTDDESLGDSFMLVSHTEGLPVEDEESTESSSTIGSLTELLSDSSGERDRDEGWDNSTDGGSSVDGTGRLTYSSLNFPIGHINAIDNVLLAKPGNQSMSISADSYIDAEATASMSDLTASRSTNLNPPRSTSSSQVQLIMPDPGSSFLTTSSSASDATTPSGSLANLGGAPAMARSRGGKGVTSWLEGSKGLWEYTPELTPAAVLDLETPRKLDEVMGDYMLLTSHDDVKEPSQAVEGKTEKTNTVAVPGGEADKTITRVQQRLRAVLALVDWAGIRDLARKWSVHMSVLAMASLVSLALLRAYGPSSSSSPLTVPAAGSAVPTVLSGGRTSIWDRLASPPIEVTTTVARSAANTPTATPLIPDLYLIKQALSTFSTQPVKPIVDGSSKCQDEAERIVTTTQRRRKASTPSIDSCCAVSVRDSNHGLIVPPKSHVEPIWRRTFDRMTGHNVSNANTDSSTQSNGTAHAQPCDCGLGTYTGTQALNRIIASFPPIYKYALAASDYLGQIYGPALAELHQEFNELMSLFKTIAETTSTLSEFVIRRAARGVSVSRQALESASQRIKEHMPPMPPMPPMPHPHVPHVDPEALIKAREKIDTLSEFVEDQAAMLADYVEEQTTLVQEKSMQSLRQAKRGLDKLIGEARQAIGGSAGEANQGVNADIGGELGRVRVQDLPGSRWHAARAARGRRPVRQQRSARPRAKIVDRVKERRARRMGPGQDQPRPPVEVHMEERSRAGKVWDAIHHGAMALVV